MNTNYRFEFLFKGVHQYVVYIYAKDINHAKNIGKKIMRDKFNNKVGYICEIYGKGIKPIAALKR